MYGSGMIIINTPWQLDQEVEKTFVDLNNRVFTDSQFRHAIF